MSLPKIKKKHRKSTTISACMMVKDGGELFVQTLESILGFVDELVVVNTDDAAETPDTKTVTELVTGIPVKMIHSPWQRDFSLHRNQSLTPASKDWVLIIDADEKLCFPEHTKPLEFKKWLAKVPAEHNGIAITLNDIQQGRVCNTTNSARLFRRGQVKYAGRVHNQPAFNGSLLVVDVPTIEHYGYDLTPEKKETKYQRQHSLLQETLADEPNNPDPLFYLCQLCGQHDLIEESIKWGERYLAFWEKIWAANWMRMTYEGMAFKPSIFFTLSGRYQALNNQEKRLEMIQQGLSIKPGDLDLAFALSQYGSDHSNTDVVIKGASMYLEAYAKISENPAKRGGSFCFTHTDWHLAVQVNRLVFIQLGAAISLLPTLFTVMGNFPQIEKHVRDRFEKMGLSSLLPEVGKPLAAVGE